MNTMIRASALAFIGTALVLVLACGNNPAAAGLAAATLSEPFSEKAVEGTELKFSDENSSVNFTGAKVSMTHPGGFKKFAGTVITDKDGKEVLGINVEIDMSSVWTDDAAKSNEKLTNHLKTADFFDVPNHPKSTFVATSVAKEGDKHKVSGNFTLHGVKKGLSFPATIVVKDGEVTAKAEFKISRKAFKIEYPGAPNDLISDDVVIKLDIKATK